MPTMVAVARAAGWPASATCRPTASAVPKICRAVNSLTMRTRGAPGPSRSSKPRPRRISTPSVRKIDGVAATAVTMRGGVSAAPACSAGAIERRSALDTPKGSPPVSDADSIDGWPRNSPSRRSSVRRARASLHSGPSRLRTATPIRSRSTPESCRASAIEYFTNIVAMMKNPAAIATCHRSRARWRRRRGGPGVDPAASAPRTSIVRVSWIAGSRPKTTSATRSDDTATPNAVTFSTG